MSELMNVLRIDVSPRGDGSVSRALTDFVLEALGPVRRVVRRDLAENPLPHFDATWINADFASPGAAGAEVA